MFASADGESSSAALDDASLRHLLGHHLAQADVPAKKAFLRQIGEPLQLRPVEFSLLVLVAHNDNVTQKQLSQALSVSAPNITIVLDRLVERELVTRTRSDVDRRSQHVRLTRKGLSLARRAQEVSLTMEREALGALSEAERAMLFELLQKVAHPRKS